MCCCFRVPDEEPLINNTTKYKKHKNYNHLLRIRPMPFIFNIY